MYVYNFSMDNRFQIFLTKQCKFFLNTIFTLWMTGLPCPGKTTIAKNLEKESIKNVIYTRDLSITILEIAKKIIKNPNILTKYGLVPEVRVTNYIK